MVSPYAYRRQIQKPVRKKRKKRYIILLLLILLAGGFFVLKKYHHPLTDVQQHEQPTVSEKAPVADDTQKENITSHTIAEGDIPAEIFGAYGHYDANDTAALLAASEGVFDFTHLKIGQPLRFYFPDDMADDNTKATRLEYDCNTEKMVIAERSDDGFQVREEGIRYETRDEIAKGTIDNFFYADALEAGLSEPTVLEVGDIFSFSIDFTTEIRQGDAFVFVYEKRTRDGAAAPDGRILAAKFVNDGTAHYAYYFDNDGEGGYYDGDGHVLERQFLKAPLSYRQITSTFTGARMHPITKKVSAHYQVDYAAPTGTPVVASARGTVASAGWEGGWGNIIRMQHDNGYTTHYGHLSAFAKGVASGAHIEQGQVIGYVGSTGWSTGPHLDYGMKLNGTPINPLTFVQPKGAPLPQEKMDVFNAIREKYRDILQ